MLSDYNANSSAASPTESGKPLLVTFFGEGPVFFADNEIPAGTINGINDTFTLLHAPVSGSTQIFLNGVLQPITTGYTVAGNVITFTATYIPQTGDNLYAFYRY